MADTGELGDVGVGDALAMARDNVGAGEGSTRSSIKWCYRRWRFSAGFAGSSFRPVGIWCVTRVFEPARQQHAKLRGLLPAREDLAWLKPWGPVPRDELLRRVVASAVLACPCGGRRRVVAVVVNSVTGCTVVAARLPSTAATVVPARAWPQAELWFADAV